PGDIPLAITTKHLATITLDQSQALPDYVSHSFHLDPLLLEQVRTANRGAIMAGLNLTIVRSLELHLPPLAIQHEVVNAIAYVRTLESHQEEALRTADDLYHALAQRGFRGELVGAEPVAAAA